jgi:hypothetical protein
MQYDLRVPSKKIVPKKTPLMNRDQPRQQRASGGALEFRRIVGWTNSRTGGVPDMMAGFNSEATNTFGGVTGLRRPNKIQYVTDAKIDRVHRAGPVRQRHAQGADARAGASRTSCRCRRPR